MASARSQAASSRAGPCVLANRRMPRRTEPLLGVRAPAQDHVDEHRGACPDLACPPPEALRRPVGIAPVARRHVLRRRRVLAVR
jgi:hypothetical protein